MRNFVEGLPALLRAAETELTRRQAARPKTLTDCGLDVELAGGGGHVERFSFGGLIVVGAAILALGDDLGQLMISSSGPMWRVDLYVFAFTLSLIAWMAFLTRRRRRPCTATRPGTSCAGCATGSAAPTPPTARPASPAGTSLLP